MHMQRKNNFSIFTTSNYIYIRHDFFITVKNEPSSNVSISSSIFFQIPGNQKQTIANFKETDRHVQNHEGAQILVLVHYFRNLSRRKNAVENERGPRARQAHNARALRTFRYCVVPLRPSVHNFYSVQSYLVKVMRKMTEAEAFVRNGEIFPEKDL